MMPPQFLCTSVLQPYFVACGGMSPPHKNMQWQVAAVLTCAVVNVGWIKTSVLKNVKCRRMKFVRRSGPVELFKIKNTAV